MGVYLVFWAERVNPCEFMGCSLYFAVTGAHPILQFNISEATCLQSLLMSIPSTPKSIQHNSKPPANSSSSISILLVTSMCGDLILMCNTQIEKSLNKRYAHNI
jgi:hypothetical protein